MTILYFWKKTLYHWSILQNTTTENETDQVYRTNPVLKYSKIPLKAPLLPLPYGQSQSSREFTNQGCCLRPSSHELIKVCKAIQTYAFKFLLNDVY